MNSRKNSFACRLAMGVAAAAILPAVSLAAPDDAVAGKGKDGSDTTTIQEVIVTGTSLRKVAPAGAEAIALSKEDIVATGATNVATLLASVPQLNSFGQTPAVGGNSYQLTVNRTDLRNLPQGGSSPTLILVDGHRVVGAGVLQTFPDPDIVPPALIQRVEVAPDGGSAIYGSDAVGGVINFVTRRDFDGAEAAIREGIGDHYKSTDINLTVGKSWDKGSYYIGYNYSGHDPIYGHDRSYVRNVDYATGLPTGLSCNPGNVSIGSSLWAIQSGALVPGSSNVCDLARATAIYPEEKRHTVMAGFRQELTNTLEFDVKGYFSHRADLFDSGPEQGSASVASSNPNYISTGGATATATQLVGFNFAPVAGQVTNARTTLQTWGVTPTLTWKMPHDWQMRAFYNYGESQTRVHEPQVNSVALSTGVTSGLINPYNIAASDPTALAGVLNYENYGRGDDTLNNAKVTFDGPVITLPGGEVRLAVGGEYIRETYSGVVSTASTEATSIAPLSSAKRNVKSGFAEINIPLIGEGNRLPFLYSAALSIAERYDDYSDFGQNWSPNLGATVKPVSWLSVRGRWNKAFQAPSLAQLAAATSTASVYPASIAGEPFLHNPATPYVAGQVLVNVSGIVSPLQPQTGKDYDFGFDINPPVFPGLGIHFTYYNILYRGAIDIPPSYIPNIYWANFQSAYKMNPTLAQMSAFLAAAGVSPAGIQNAIASVNGQGGSVYVVEDGRQRNLGVSKVNGFDIAFDYHRDVSFGTVYAKFNSSYQNSVVTAADGIDFTDNQAGVNSSRFNFNTVVGATVGENFLGQLTWNHLAGFTLSPAAALGQTRVSAFDTFDLYLQYEVQRNGLPPTTLSLGVTNLLDQNPPKFNGESPNATFGYDGQTLGRVIQLGASVKY